MNVTETIRARRSIRKYKSNAEISQQKIQTILEAAMMAPSACNMRPWEFVVLRSEEARNKVLKIHDYARHIKNASVGIIVCTKSDGLNEVQSLYFPQDCGASIQNMLLQSWELGYGSCWCGIYPREKLVRAYQEEFGLQGTPVALVILGVADEAPEARGFYEAEKVKYL